MRLPGPTHLVILVDWHPRQQWLRQAVEKRLREELAKLQVEVNEEKSLGVAKTISDPEFQL